MKKIGKKFLEKHDSLKQGQEETKHQIVLHL